MKEKFLRVLNNFWFRNSLMMLGIVIVFAIVSVCSFLFMDKFYFANAKKQILKAADEISVLDLKDKNNYSTLSDIEAAYDIYIEMYYPRDKLVYTSEINKSIYESSKEGEAQTTTLKPRIMKILEHEDLSADSYYETRQEYFATAKYVVYGTYLDNGSAIEIYYSVDTILSNSKTTKILVLIICGVILAVFMILAMIYVATFTVPLMEIISITKKIAQMDFSQICPRFRVRELNELGDSVNSLSSSLDMSMKELRKKNRRLELEVEKQKLLEESRKQFIANASHELKTPIAIIQGYAEGLKYGITNGNAEEYCDVIMEESDKMNALVRSLIDNSKYENFNIECKPIDFSVSEMVDSLIEERQSFFQNRGITVRSNISKGFVCNADPDLFERVFGNYFSNAVSHADGEKLIKINCEQVGEFYRISVFNTGKPIADEDIDKIWSSFYRADKAHSRSENRFGLGLSIVANVQRIQKAKYGVNNHENGVEFWFDVSAAK